MPQKLYDSEGNEVEVPTQDEINMKVTEATKPLEDQLKTFKDRDYNFDLLRKKVQRGEELNQKEQEVYEKEKKVREEEENLKKEKTDWNRKVINSWEQKAIRDLTGNDDEMIVKITDIMNNDLKAIEATTEQEIQIKAEKAYTLATGKKPSSANPMARAVSSAGNSNAKAPKDTSFADSDKGKDILDAMGFGGLTNEKK